MSDKNDKKVYICDRRDLLKWTAAGYAFMMVADFDEMYAAGTADILAGNIAPDKDLLPADKELFQWIDGPFGTQFGTGYETAITKVKMAVHVDLEHKAESFVEAVFIADSKRKIVGSQTFAVSQANSKGRAPYAVFDNMYLNPAETYFIYYIVKKGAESLIYRYTLGAGKIAQSRLDYTHLNSRARQQIPANFIADMNNATTNHQIEGKPELGKGFLTTPYEHFAGFPTHNVRFKLRNIAANGSFTMEIGKMHNDANADHYMRYFLVLDPVGRVLGGLRRDFGAEGTVASHDVTNALVGLDNPGAGYKPSDLNITDCPYVQVITEDKRDALSRTTFRLR